jgi:glycosyltransferase involved in cell wall biosynthesis
VAVLSSRRPDVPLVMFGTGSEARILRSIADSFRVPLAMPGHVPTREALAQLAVLALPSLMENSPMVLLEAMAAGVPVVASRVGGIPELAPPGTALLVAPKDPRALRAAIERLLDDHRLREDQVAAARAHVEAHGTAALMARRTLAVYESIA